MMRLPGRLQHDNYALINIEGVFLRRYYAYHAA